MFSLEESRDLATEFDDLIVVAQVFTALVIKTKACDILESVWNDLSCHLPNCEFTDLFTELFEILVDLEQSFDDARVIVAVIS